MHSEHKTISLHIFSLHRDYRFFLIINNHESDNSLLVLSKKLSEIYLHGILCKLCYFKWVNIQLPYNSHFGQEWRSIYYKDAWFILSCFIAHCTAQNTISTVFRKLSNNYNLSVWKLIHSRLWLASHDLKLIIHFLWTWTISKLCGTTCNSMANNKKAHEIRIQCKMYA